jgi:hypothetical protein
MAKKGRRAQRQRKKRHARGRALKPIDHMNKALGEFLTACGEVEFKMILFANLISEPGIEAIFHDLSGPFGPKIKAFKEWCDFSGVSDAKRPLLDRVYKKLDTLLPKRNFIVHGETWDGQFKGKPKQPYRVGIIKKDLDYIDMFFRGEHGANIFSVEQVRAVTRECQDIAADLDTLRASKN